MRALRTPLHANRDTGAASLALLVSYMLPAVA